jgi:hypothetical protein
MKACTAQVLIAGAGWRVSRFIVPALLNEGVSADCITILRRSANSPLGRELEGTRIVGNLEDVADTEYPLTINCVSRESLATMQRALVERVPHALHFCDTPIINDWSEVFSVPVLRRARLYSLEDWPLMPNLMFLAHELARADGPAHLSVEHFGIIGHFVSIYRSLCGWPLASRKLVPQHNVLVGHPTAEKRVTFRSPKDFPVAKVSLRTDAMLLEDFHEIETAAHDDSEVLYRVVDGGCLRYYRGPREISAHPVVPALMEWFLPFGDRKNVHELDKFVGLSTLFRAALRNDPAVAYSYIHSIRDSLTARRLAAGKTALLF